MGRLTPVVRQGRTDPHTCSRSVIARRPGTHYPCLRDAALAAREAGRSCYFRPLFDRPRHWAEQRTPRHTPVTTK